MRLLNDHTFVYIATFNYNENCLRVTNDQSKSEENCDFKGLQFNR